MKLAFIVLALLLTMAKQANIVIYPNAYDVDCFSDACLGDLVAPAIEYDGEGF